MIDFVLQGRPNPKPPLLLGRINVDHDTLAVALSFLFPAHRKPLIHTLTLRIACLSNIRTETACHIVDKSTW